MDGGGRGDIDMTARERDAMFAAVEHSDADIVSLVDEGLAQLEAGLPL